MSSSFDIVDIASLNKCWNFFSIDFFLWNMVFTLQLFDTNVLNSVIVSLKKNEAYLSMCAPVEVSRIY